MTTSRITILPVTNPDTSAQQLTTTAWTPAQLGSSLVGWYKADAGVTLDASNNVTAIADQSGNGGPSLVQATTANTPELTANFQNGLPAITADKWVYNSVQPYLRSAAPVPAFSFTPATPFTLALAFYKESSGTYAGIDGGYLAPLLSHISPPSNSINGWGLGAYGGSTPTLQFMFGAGMNLGTTNGINVISSTHLNANAAHVAIVSYDGSGKAAGVSILLDGAIDPGPTVVVDTLPSAISYSAAEAYILPDQSSGVNTNDPFFEGAIINRALSLVERVSLNAYLRTRWGI